MSRRSRPSARALALASAAIAGVLVLASCAGEGGGRLLVAEAPAPDSDATSLRIWSVDPGDELTDDALVAPDATAPVEIATPTHHGLDWVNTLGRTWADGDLLAFGNEAGQNVVTAGPPGEDRELLASGAQTRVQVLRRGAFVETPEQCRLASSPTAVDDVGTGRCAVSSDERWVASWTNGQEGLTIRDLRDDSTVTVDDVTVTSAVVLAAQARVVAVTADDRGLSAVMLSAEDGRRIGEVEPTQLLEVAEPVAESDGVVLQAGTQDGVTLLYMATDGTVEEIDRGDYLAPLTNAHGEVTYLRYSFSLEDNSLQRWESGGEPEVLLEGAVGAGPVDAEHVVAVREVDGAVEVLREEHGEFREVVTLDVPTPAEGTAPAAGPLTQAVVAQSLVMGDMVHLQIDTIAGSSYVRVDLVGDDSDIPVANATGLRLESLDHDGTALLLLQSGDAEEPGVELAVVRPHHDEPEVRARVGSAGPSLIHHGVLYYTDGSDPARVSVRSVSVSGERDDRKLYPNSQVVGATWPQQGGALRTQVLTPQLLLRQQAQAQQQQQQAAAGAVPPPAPEG